MLDSAYWSNPRSLSLSPSLSLFTCPIRPLLFSHILFYLMSNSSANGDLAVEKEIDKLCKDLDAIALKYLSKLEEYTQNWQITSRQLQQGFMHLAHAKYTMGPTTISPCSYDERMKAQTRVTVTGQQVMPLEIPPPESSNTSSSGIRLRQPQLRRNRHHNPWRHDNYQRDSADHNEFEMDEKLNRIHKNATHSRDPLHWFGLLVSPSLRTSQDHFKIATHRLIEQVNFIHELDALEVRYRKLEQQKLSLMESIKAHD
ncbi:hypothetical protein BX666DRAFT_1945451 [Dichotomocladium elegans]|nr:hypothetical protein BX666DRAFT_1945451 [Dichotomocladium elegans]